MDTLSASSGLVLLWSGRESYKSKAAQSFFDKLDLTHSKPLYDEYNSIWSSYDQVIKNRKFGVWFLVKQALEKNNISQVICLASGLDPLSLQIADFYPDTHVFDVDLDHMEYKSQLTREVSKIENISFIESDITNHKQLIKKLRDKMWDPKAPSLIIMEGISYYLKKDQLFQVVNNLMFRGVLILEYLVPFQLVDIKRRHIPEAVFGKIKENFNLPFIIKYSNDDIKKLAQNLEGKTQCTLNICDLEKKRTQKNTTFQETI